MRIPFLLLAEDDEDDRYLFIQAIGSVDPSIIYAMAANGRELLALLENDFFSLPDYVILDLNMPLMNGFECLSVIKSSPLLRSCLVIVYSTTMDQQTEQQLLAAGAFACFIKPAAPSELADVLRRLLGY